MNWSKNGDTYRCLECGMRSHDVPDCAHCTVRDEEIWFGLDDPDQGEGFDEDTEDVRSE